MKDSELAIEIIDPRPLIMEVYALHESFAVSKKVQIKINPMAKVSCIGDRNALRLILRNLLSNAIKFTPRNGIIIIDIENAENSCNIIIQDSGIGMNSDTIKYLFQYQRDRISIGTNQEGGSGLGLYICKEFLEKMNGKIFVESQPGKGSRFIVELVKSN
jgi:signal transduction histidine kinase